MCKKLMKYVVVCAVLAVLGGTVIASPVIDSAVISTRIWNDNPTSTVTTVNHYADWITIDDDQRGSAGGGWGNLHDFRLSADGGSTAASFANGDAFEFFADVLISGTGNAEAGLQVAPWWSSHGDGKFMVNGQSGEIACFGGRLPFYSFTVSQSLTYTKGDTVRMGIVYLPNSLSALDPATIEYFVTIAGTEYSSGAIAFDEGNPAEGYGSWGMLDFAQVGGYFQPQVGNTTNWERVDFDNMVYVPEPATMMILGLGSLFLARRRK